METIQAVGLALMITGAILGIAGNLPPLYDIIRDAVTSWFSPEPEATETEKKPSHE